MKYKYILYSCIVVLLVLVSNLLIMNKKERRTEMTLADKQITNVTYQKNGIDAEYPQFISGSEEKRNEWNRIIKSDFDQILGIYSFNPFPIPTPSPGSTIPTILKISYDMKLNNDTYASILYRAAFNSQFAAHPSELVYITNIDKKNSTRLTLPDYVKLDNNFIKNFRTWKLVSDKGNNPDVIQGIKDYLAGLSDEDLLMGMKASDKIGSGNLYGIFSYLTKDRLGISIGVPNYLGDHVEFEQDYSKLKDYLKPSFQIPSN